MHSLGPTTTALGALFCIALLGSCSEAQKTGIAENCTLDNNYCTPFMGCIDTNSILFIGNTFGRFGGPLEAKTNQGAICKGDWTRNAQGGRAQFTCDDGRSGKVSYTSLHRPTGTAVGNGRTNRGEAIDVWAGFRIIDYLARDERLNQDVARCGKAVIQPDLR